MAATRASTGHSKPRVLPSISTTPERKRKSTTTVTKPTTKKATAKKSTTSAGVTKKRAANTHHKRNSSLTDKVKGAALKAEGVITQKPGKKAAGTKKMRGTDGKGSRTTKKA